MPFAKRAPGWWQDPVFYLVAAAPVLMLVAADLCLHHTIVRAVLMGSGDHDPPNVLRNGAEFLSFVAAIFVAAIAGAALPFARRQAREAEDARLSAIYMNIVERWYSKELVCARARILAVCDTADRAWDSDPGVHAGSREDYEKAMLCSRLQELKSQRRHLRLRSYTAILMFFEDLGLLCRKNYIRQRDVFDLVGAQLQFLIGVFEHYITAARSGGGDQSIYANAIYLFRAHGEHVAQGEKYTEPEWPIRTPAQRPAPNRSEILRASVLRA